MIIDYSVVVKQYILFESIIFFLAVYLTLSYQNQAHASDKILVLKQHNRLELTVGEKHGLTVFLFETDYG